MVTVAVPETTLDSHELLALSEMLEGGALKLRGRRGEEIILPEVLSSVLRETVRNLQQGQRVSLIAREEQLSTQMAAEILGCSRPHVVALLETGQIPFVRVGSHRRIRYADLTAYMKKRDEERHEGLNQMSRDAVAWGVYRGIPLERDQNDE
jgi:excisionase family DNA binding protein